jgi:4-alpha-glucanotransferase
MNSDSASQLRRLAEMNGVQPAYLDAANKNQVVQPEVLAGVLKALDVPAENENEIHDSSRTSRLRHYRQGIEPVTVAWDQSPIKILCHFPAKSSKRVRVRLTLEEGERARPGHSEARPRGSHGRVTVERELGTEEIDGEHFTTRELVLPPLPFGYHTLKVSAGDLEYRTLILSAPIRSFDLRGIESRGNEFPKNVHEFLPLSGGLELLGKQRKESAESGGPPRAERAGARESLGRGEDGRKHKLSSWQNSFDSQVHLENQTWGAFLPMYAAHSEKSWGAGNFSDWERLSRWFGSQGASVAATLPLLAAFLDYPVCEPSPYSPASRLFWNEFFLDITAVPEFAACREAQSLVRSEAFQMQLRDFRRSEFIDYQAQWAARRNVLELLAKHFFSKASSRRTQFERFLREHSEMEQYTAFRAVCDKLRTSWHNWPQRLRDGTLRKGDYEKSVQQFHSYVQWLAHTQMEELIRRTEKNGVQLYLDLPLGVHPDGYDVWRERESFALGASAGAPPDLFFSKGQDWGFAPLHPRRIRETGYRHLLAFLRFQMHHARLLRIDHVMGLHRLYWVPRGFEARQGAYVTYPAEELHAIFNLESHRNRTRLVGENLGTVPLAVNESMKRHGLREMFVVQFQQRPDPKAALCPPPPLSVSSVNTHDTPTFAAHWRGDDLSERIRLGLLPHKQLKAAKKNREILKKSLVKFLKEQGFLKNLKPRPQEVLHGLLAWLKASESEIVLINLEDLWLEKRPQNVPGTSSERPNWRRKAQLTLEEIFKDSRLRKLIPF